MAAHQAPLSLGFSRQEQHWSGFPFPSPMHESEATQSCLTLSDRMDRSPPGSSIHGIFQARALEWGAIAFYLVALNLPEMQETQLQSLDQEDPLEKEMTTYFSFLPEESHGQRSLVGYSPWGRKESDTTERLTLSRLMFTTPTQRHLPRRKESYVQHQDLYMDIHRSFVHDRPKLGTTQMCISCWMDKPLMAYPHNGIVLSNKKA